MHHRLVFTNTQPPERIAIESNSCDLGCRSSAQVRIMAALHDAKEGLIRPVVSLSAATRPRICSP